MVLPADRNTLMVPSAAMGTIELSEVLGLASKFSDTPGLDVALVA